MPETKVEKDELGIWVAAQLGVKPLEDCKCPNCGSFNTKFWRGVQSLVDIKSELICGDCGMITVTRIDKPQEKREPRIRHWSERLPGEEDDRRIY